MKDAPPAHACFRFGVFELDPESGELRKHGLKVKLQAQPFQILRILLEQPGRVVTRDELRRRVWPSDTFVDFNQGLYNATKKLREALGDSADAPHYIETLSRRGYRFIAAVTGTESGTAPPIVLSPVPSAAATCEHPRKLRVSIALGLVAAALLATVLLLVPSTVWQRVLGNAAIPQIRSVAVLPFQNLSLDPAQEYFSDGVTDALITQLAQIGSVKVISRTSIMRYKKTERSLPEIARELGVDGIVEGAVQRAGDRVRITAQLIYGPSDRHLWAYSYERDMRDVFNLERAIADDIGHQVQARITAGNSHEVAKPLPVNLDALDAYLQGNSHLAKADAGPRDEELRKAAQYFQRAINADPTFAPAYIGMAEAHHNLWSPSNEDFGLMRAFAEKALELAPDSSDAHEAMGTAKFENWDWMGAEEEYRRALALNPNNAAAHEQLGDTLEIFGRVDEAWKEYQVAQELDPNQDHLSDALYLRGQYDRAIELLRRMAERRPDDGTVHWKLSQNYLQKHLYREWVQQIGQTLTIFGFPAAASRVERSLRSYGYVEALRQWSTELQQLARNQQSYFPGILGEVYAAMGDKDKAFYWLEQGCEHRHMAISDPVLEFVRVDPAFAPLRSDPRFKDVLRCMRLWP